MSVAVITGSAGLVGSEAVRYFAGLGFDVVGIDNDMRAYFFGEEASTAWNRERLQGQIRSYSHLAIDVRDEQEVTRLFDRHGVIALVYGIVISLLTLPLGFLGGYTGAVASVVCWATGLGAQDACLRSGIAQVVSMNKRGAAFGAFNGVFGVSWFFGSSVMGALYGASLGTLVAFGVIGQLAAAVMFLRLKGSLEAARS